MFRLTEFYENIMKKPLPTECGITCEIVDSYIAKLNRLLTESLSCFSYTLVIAGTALVNYDDKIVTLTKNDLLIYTPGMMIKTLEVSEDFSAFCLMGDEAVTYEIPYARNAIRATYFPAVVYSDNKLTLTDCEAHWLENRMKEIYLYINSKHIYKNECLYSLYSLFILDLLNVENRFKKASEFNSHTIDLFLRFLKLLTENFINHHDIAFYADALAVTTVYLSRIVKRLSGQTVKNHIDRLLVMEAAYLLVSTDEPITSIAEKLNFANPASFCKFFIRHKKISPRTYRTSGPLNS
ncbi:MAG: helix-turn-helix domain-containing protein [Muribaculaceae bacterium]|nr:helix-turn-helix domain-containing protein [Muribaculaceae bacterium]